jgi:uncharacterized membrane protein
MNVALWMIQALLAAAYVMIGSIHVSRPLEELSKRMAWVSAVPAGFVRFIGVAEVVGAIGLIVPMVTNIAAWLTTAAAAGLVLLQAFAIVFHLSRHEAHVVASNAVLLLLAAFVLVGRVAIVPVA